MSRTTIRSPYRPTFRTKSKAEEMAEAIGEFIGSLLGLAFLLAIDCAVSLGIAQIACFGLSVMHVNTGLEGLWLIAVALSILVSVNSHKSKS